MLIEQATTCSGCSSFKLRASLVRTHCVLHRPKISTPWGKKTQALGAFFISVRSSGTSIVKCFFFIRISWSLFRCWCCTKLEWCICIQCVDGGAYWSEGVWGWKKEAGYKRSGRNTREQSAYNDGKVNLEEKIFYECISWNRDALALVSLDIWNGKIESNQ